MPIAGRFHFNGEPEFRVAYDFDFRFYFFWRVLPMAGQGVQRRNALRMLAMAAGIAKFPGFSKWALACGHAGNGLTGIKPANYRPVFFSAREYALVERLAGIIIPNDETPGACEAGVPEFIDLMVSRDASLQPLFRDGLIWLDMHSEKMQGKQFLRLLPDQQTALLEPLAYAKKFRDGEQEGRQFFERMREYTVMGFYTSKVGLTQLDFPGLRSFWVSPSCPHQDDPEHVRLPPAKTERP
jgi:gluconate 2-dehydrogenase gamma chain